MKSFTHGWAGLPMPSANTLPSTGSAHLLGHGAAVGIQHSNVLADSLLLLLLWLLLVRGPRPPVTRQHLPLLPVPLAQLLARVCKVAPRQHRQQVSSSCFGRLPVARQQE